MTFSFKLAAAFRSEMIRGGQSVLLRSEKKNVATPVRSVVATRTGKVFGQPVFIPGKLIQINPRTTITNSPL